MAIFDLTPTLPSSASPKVASSRTDATAATLLFERLPDRLFAPLASANRHRHWALLCWLHRNRFGPDAPMPPSQGFAVREIVHDIEGELLTQDLWEPEQDGGDVASVETPLNIRAIQIFHRFEEAGWFRLEKYGIEKRVTMRPAVNQFLTILVTFAETEPVFLSGKIRSIDLSIQEVLKGTENGNGDTLKEAAEQTRHLLEHVRNTGTNIRDIMESLSRETSTADYVRRFFDDYIEQVFIGDYTELRLTEHPLSRRQKIIQAVEEIYTTDSHRERLIAWYEVKQCQGDRKKAETLFEKDIHRLFELRRIDEYLDRLDDEIRRANRRALTYLDYRLRSMRPVDQLVKQAIEAALAGHLPAISDPFPAGEMICGERLAVPRKAIDRAPPSSLRRERPSEAQIARAHVMQRAREARSVTPPKLAAFVAQRLAGADSLVLETIADVRAYQTLATVGLAMSSNSRRLQLSATAMAKGFRVTLGDEIDPDVNTESTRSHIAGRPFTIDRRKPRPEKV